MNIVFAWMFAIGCFSLVAGVSIGFLCFLKYKKASKALKAIKRKLEADLPESLDLATMPQLLDQIRKRNNLQFIMILPQQDEDITGLKIESFNLSTVAMTGLLTFAAGVARQEAEKLGLDFEKIDNFRNFFREDEDNE